MNTREKTTTNQANKSTDTVDMYVITFPEDGPSPGHTTMEFRHKDGSSVIIPETNKEARISVFPSTREHKFKNTLLNQFFNFIGYRPKSNTVGDLTGVPVPAFSTKSLEHDIKYQRNAPESIIKIEDVPRESAIKTTKELHDDLENKNIQFALNYATGWTPTYLRMNHVLAPTCKKISSGIKHENSEFVKHTGMSMPDDLICAGGGYLNHMPDDAHTNINPLPEFSNCTGVVKKAIEKTGIVTPSNRMNTLFPVPYSEDLRSKGVGIEVIDSPDHLPKDMHTLIAKAKEDYPRPSTNIPADLDLDSHFARASMRNRNSAEERS